MSTHPLPGHAVRLTAPWSILKPGKIGILEGLVGVPHDDFSIIFNVIGAFRGGPTGKDPDEYVSCSGGPGTISTPADQLTPTDETVTLWFWRWRDLPRAGGGEPYQLTVPLWEWSGTNRKEERCLPPA